MSLSLYWKSLRLSLTVLFHWHSAYIPTQKHSPTFIHSHTFRCCSAVVLLLLLLLRFYVRIVDIPSPVFRCVSLLPFARTAVVVLSSRWTVIVCSCWIAKIKKLKTENESLTTEHLANELQINRRHQSDPIVCAVRVWLWHSSIVHCTNKRLVKDSVYCRQSDST